MASPATRIDYLDGVRAFALLLGIVFHASLSFMPVYIGWAVMDVSTGDIVPVFVLVSHSFRMELFFLVAGFFSRMTLQRKGMQDFLSSRLLRIGLPFVAGWFVLRPLLVSGWILGGQSLRGDVDVAAALEAGFATFGSLPAGLFVGTHLWFLYYLLLITALTLLVRGCVGVSGSLSHTGSRVLDTLTAWVARSRAGLLVAALPVAGCLWFMDNWGMDTPDRSLVPDLQVLAVYGGFFVFGWCLQRVPVRMDDLSRLSAWRLVCLVVALVVTVFLADVQSEPTHARYAWLRGVFVFTYAVMMWHLVAASIGLFRRFFDRPSPVVRYLADASYWLYLVHLPLVVWLQVMVAEWPLHWSIKLAVVCLATVGLSLLVYDAVVRSTWAGKVLNGRRRPRVIFGRARSGL
ncbi:acyltransferase family protein [Marinihelvus fidelis]|uniref:Acyltransferase family protein n=1 Tax=Marinihelvus fidelis TaxID=2613842 RepID=A0A5N0TGC0_9GAMM|nr:acyltransferase family protein [Marinihelvus fidelis]KAA9134135.1 acyltransferase family protein [Marinihelvus fidelis]